MTEGATQRPAAAPDNSARPVVRQVQRPGSVLVVGGGTAGWITAALLRRTAPPGVSVTLIESPDIATIGVGEATLPSLRQVFRYMGVDEAELLADCDATFKLGIRFCGWNPQRDYWHPFGAITGPVVVTNDWLRRAAAGAAPPIDEVLDQGTWKIAAAHLAPQSARSAPYAGEMRVYAYHLDAARLAELLRRHAVAAGVHHVVDNVTNVVTGPGGWISHVETNAHGALAADLFFDCTGFRGLLIEGALGEPYQPFRQQLWCDRAVALNVPAEPAARGDLPPYTRATARSSGWIWEIPLFSRSGNGYVYCSAYQDPGSAEAELRAYLGVDDEMAARHINIRAGKRRRVWVANCIAVGLAGGFIEPLESTGIALIEDVGEFFLHYAPDLAWDDTFVAKMNDYMDAAYDYVRDFVACHYVTASRDDTPFWRDVKHDPSVRTPAIDEVLSQWHRGELNEIRHSDGSRPAFPPYSWAYIIGGNGMRPQRAHNATIDPAELAQAAEELQANTAAVAALAGVLPDNRERVRSLRDSWQRGERPAARPDPDAYVGRPHQLQTSYVGDARTAVALQPDRRSDEPA